MRKTPGMKFSSGLWNGRRTGQGPVSYTHLDVYKRQLTGKSVYEEILPVLKKDADRKAFDTMLEELSRRIPGTSCLSFEQTDKQLEESFAQIKMLAWGLILFIGLIGLLNIVNTVYTNIHTRINEIGTQRAIGMLSLIHIWIQTRWDISPEIENLYIIKIDVYKRQRKRRGGNGLYYHSSYWASPGMLSLIHISCFPGGI